MRCIVTIKYHIKSVQVSLFIVYCLPIVSSLLTFISSATEDEASTAIAVAVAVATGIGATVIEFDVEFINILI